MGNEPQHQRDESEARAHRGRHACVEPGGLMRLFSNIDIRIEPCQAQRATHGERQRRCPAKFGRIIERPEIEDRGRSHAKRDHVGQRIQFGTEPCIRLEQPGDPSVDAVEHARADDQKQRQQPFFRNGRAQA